MDLLRRIPTGSAGKPAKSGGRCLVCDKQYSTERMLIRALFHDIEGEEEWGLRVCAFCSPYISDEVLLRFNLDMEDWDFRWKHGLDSNSQTFKGRHVAI